MKPLLEGIGIFLRDVNPIGDSNHLRSSSCETTPGFPGFMIAPRPAQSSGNGFDLNRLISDRRAFSSIVRFFELGGTRVGTRFAGR
jgi:hypothetical protein